MLIRQPSMPTQAYKTYAIHAPLATHFRVGTCAEADCGAHQFGWRTTVDERMELGQQQAHYIRKASGRHFTEERDEAGMTVFTFPAGQKCFATHQLPLERPENFLVWRGDHRTRPRRDDIRVHKRGADWVDDFANHQQKLADRFNQG